MSIEISRKISDLQGCIAGGINLGILYLDKGLLEKAETFFKDSLKNSIEISHKLNECVCLTNLGDIQFERGNNNEALGLYERSLEMAKEISVPIGEAINQIAIARVLINKVKLEGVEELLDSAFKIFNEAGELTYISDCHRFRSKYELLKDNHNAALDWCSKSIGTSEECRSDIKKLKALRQKAYILVKMQEYNQAAKLYSEAIALALQLETDYEAAKGYFGRYHAYSLMGMVEEAGKDLSFAVDCISKVDACRWTERIAGSYNSTHRVGK